MACTVAPLSAPTMGLGVFPRERRRAVGTLRTTSPSCACVSLVLYSMLGLGYISVLDALGLREGAHLDGASCDDAYAASGERLGADSVKDDAPGRCPLEEALYSLHGR